MSWVQAYLAMSAAMSEDRTISLLSLAQMPAHEAESTLGTDRKERADQLAQELLRIATALEEASA